ncbi:MAG: 50S ribosomal protein L3 [Phycisphaeraceae bacterium]|nr:50S ribosomal protein L3 [Phycisphaerales bacterium]MCB9842628.1 50S ribosomal protein L3 [Phycisphaeraceae bacterium]
MALKLLGTKLGMTRVFTDEGVSTPVTVIEVGPCVVTQIKTVAKDGYSAVQIGFDDVKPRRSTMPMIGHDGKAGTGPKRHHVEFRVDEKEAGEFELGQSLTVESFAKHAFVDVSGTSKGKGFQGTMKRHNFKGQPASHGVERKHRSPGSIGGHATNRGTGPKPKKGKRMAGHMGDERVTVRSLGVLRVDAERNLLLVKGSVPGANKSLVEIRTPTRLYKSKGDRQKEAMA